jgi:hypothetical protein
VKTLAYLPGLKIRNTEALPAGTGCKYLVCINGQNEELVAKQWKRVKPLKIENNEVLIVFRG